MKFGSSFTDTFKKQVRFILSGFIQRGIVFSPGHSVDDEGVGAW